MILLGHYIVFHCPIIWDISTKDCLFQWSIEVAGITEVPPVAILPNFIVQRKVLRPFRYQTGGTILVRDFDKTYTGIYKFLFCHKHAGKKLGIESVHK